MNANASDDDDANLDGILNAIGISPTSSHRVNLYTNGEKIHAANGSSSTIAENSSPYGHSASFSDAFTPYKSQTSRESIVDLSDSPELKRACLRQRSPSPLPGTPRLRKPLAQQTSSHSSERTEASIIDISDSDSERGQGTRLSSRQLPLASASLQTATQDISIISINTNSDDEGLPPHSPLRAKPLTPPADVTYSTQEHHPHFAAHRDHSDNEKSCDIQKHDDILFDDDNAVATETSPLAVSSSSSMDHAPPSSLGENVGSTNQKRGMKQPSTAHHHHHHHHHRRRHRKVKTIIKVAMEMDFEASLTGKMLHEVLTTYSTTSRVSHVTPYTCEPSFQCPVRGSIRWFATSTEEHASVVNVPVWCKYFTADAFLHAIQATYEPMYEAILHARYAQYIYI
jgi:hypothetical protein